MHFGDAWVTGYEPLVAHMANDEKDRHVLAAAVSCGAPIIVTFNVRTSGESTSIHGEW